MSFLKMFRDWAGTENEELKKFNDAWDNSNKYLISNYQKDSWSHFRDLAWQIYILQKEVELLRMKKD